MHFQINDSTGAVTLYPRSVPPVLPGHTNREATPAEVASLAAPGGKIVFRDGALTRLPAVTPVPLSITRVQLRLWLARRTPPIPDSAVEAQIATLAEPAKTEALIRWQDSADFLRANPLVIELGQALGLDSAALDTAFREAAKL